MLQIVGGPVPPNTAHAISVSLPTWKANVAYEEGEDWVFEQMECGYPRFFIHPLIQSLAEEIIRHYGDANTELAMLFPSQKTAQVCQEFIVSRIPRDHIGQIRIVNFVPSHAAVSDIAGAVRQLDVAFKLSCVIYPKSYFPLAKQVWQHTGDGISSRRSEFCLNVWRAGYLVEEGSSKATELGNSAFHKGPRRYQQKSLYSKPPPDNLRNSKQPLEAGDLHENDQFIEERFGRNLSLALASKAKLAIRRRIAGSLTANVDLNEALENDHTSGRLDGLKEDDVFLFPSGMSAIFHTHQNLLSARNPLKCVCFGFPYIDTLKILTKWGTGCLFYGNGSSQDLDDLEKKLINGERFLALFTEFPGNPLLKAPDLGRIHQLARKYDFAVVVDETVGNFINVNVLPYADVVVSSLTKIFSGDSNVMAGSAVLNPQSPFYNNLKTTFVREFEDNFWLEDAIFLERNSRDFVARIERINATTEAVAETLKASPLVKEVYYPKYSPTRPQYEFCRNPNGGYGGLLSVTFHSTLEASTFFDTLEVLKGPSLGTNFTLSSPYTLLAHYGELDWASSFGVAPDLVRTSVGLEDPTDLCNRVQVALKAVEDLKKS